MHKLLYDISADTFPVNNNLTQYSDDITADDLFSECTLLAGEILGVRCNDTVLGSAFQITPDPSDTKTIKGCREYHAFNNYFHENYGKRKEHCYFDTEYEAFYNLVKAWKIWKEVLNDEEKQKYFKEF